MTFMTSNITWHEHHDLESVLWSMYVYVSKICYMVLKPDKSHMSTQFCWFCVLLINTVNWSKTNLECPCDSWICNFLDECFYTLCCFFTASFCCWCFEKLSCIIISLIFAFHILLKNERKQFVTVFMFHSTDNLQNTNQPIHLCIILMMHII